MPELKIWRRPQRPAGPPQAPILSPGVLLKIEIFLIKFSSKIELSNAAHNPRAASEVRESRED